MLSKKMSMAKLPQIQVVTVPAVVIGGRIYLVNSNGRRRRNGSAYRPLPASIADEIATKVKWRIVVKNMAWNGKSESAKSPNLMTPWQRKCHAIVCGLKLRWRASLGNNKRRSWDRFKTTTWDEALPRMYQQGYAAFNYHTKSPWQKWARTVAKNHNRKAEYRHEQQKAPSERIGYHVHDRTPAVQMRLEWTAS